MSFSSPARLFLALFLVVSSLILNTYALPLAQRQDGSSPQPTTVSTVDQINSSVGAMTKECTVTLEPIPNSDNVLAISKCKISQSGSQNNGSSQDGSSSSSSSSADSSTVSADSADGSSSTSTSTASDTANTVAATSSEAPSQSSPTVSNAAVSANGVSSIPLAEVSSLIAASAPAATGATTSVAGAASGATSSAASDSNAAVAQAAPSASSAASAAAEQASSSASATTAAFQLPGKKLSVLPIGLGVFAGISVIALIVVGLVTYERTKYRKAFRQRKLAESGAAMGYGGMAQRT